MLSGICVYESHCNISARRRSAKLDRGRKRGCQSRGGTSDPLDQAADTFVLAHRTSNCLYNGQSHQARSFTKHQLNATWGEKLQGLYQVCQYLRKIDTISWNPNNSYTWCQSFFQNIILFGSFNSLEFQSGFSSFNPVCAHCKAF